MRAVIFCQQYIDTKTLVAGFEVKYPHVQVESSHKDPAKMFPKLRYVVWAATPSTPGKKRLGEDSSEGESHISKGRMLWSKCPMPSLPEKYQWFGQRICMNVYV